MLDSNTGCEKTSLDSNSAGVALFSEVAKNTSYRGSLTEAANDCQAKWQIYDTSLS